MKMRDSLGTRVGSVLRRVGAQGWAALEEAVPPSAVERMRAEVGSAELLPMPYAVGAVRQMGSQLVAPGLDPRRPEATHVVTQIRQACVKSQVVRFRGFEPTEACYQRYPVGSVGVTAHRDSMRYRVLIAILTLEGEADFLVVKDRTAQEVFGWVRARPGSHVLLRAPTSTELDDRPFHLVMGPHGEHSRLSLTFRMRSGSSDAPS